MDKSRIPPNFQLLGIECPDRIEVFNDTAASRLELSQTETTVLEQIARGYSANAIAANPGVSRATIDGYFRAFSSKRTSPLSRNDAQWISGIMNAPSIALDVSQAIGTALLQDRRFPLIRVRSAVMPAAWNYLINPLHPDCADIAIAETIEYPFDSRLLR
ncbi:hypothetical protein AWJ14_08165 [Hoeflea olei]|uniref:Uncharacterized protein n=2 Tax=Hoeflea olei TaxID=1480615 RepID=A0A1C1YUB1_9HYPH|nr:hypothetical protein AWJ14_08165 [Hoeflea olei]